MKLKDFKEHIDYIYSCNKDNVKINVVYIDQNKDEIPIEKENLHVAIGEHDTVLYVNYNNEFDDMVENIEYESENYDLDEGYTWHL